MKYQSQSLGVNHSVNHHFLPGSIMTTIEEAKRPQLILDEQKENAGPPEQPQVVAKQKQKSQYFLNNQTVLQH